MRASMVLGILQTLAIAILAFFVFSDRSPLVPSTTQSTSTPDKRARPQPEDASPSPAALDEALLRRIVRQEVAAAMAAAPTQVADTQPLADPAADAVLRDQVGQALDAYKRRGAISSREMQELQQDIAHLNDDDRSQMASSLVRALNSGVVKLDYQ